MIFIQPESSVNKPKRKKGKKPDSSCPLPESPDSVRPELYSVEHLEQHARHMAQSGTISANPRKGYNLLARVGENAEVLVESYRFMAQAIQEERTITPAAEWLVDNFHIVEEQLREIRDHLPRKFYRILPKIAEGSLEGYPRVFGLAWAYAAHSDNRFDPETLRRFVKAYQEVLPLTIGELWAVPITLRIVLIENLRRQADAMVQARIWRQRADRLADEVLGVSSRAEAESGHSGAADSLREEFDPGQGQLPVPFAVQLVQRLRDQDPSIREVMSWLEERLSLQGVTAEEMVRRELGRQAAMNMSVRNTITSMRLILEFDWRDFFESVSLVDEELRHNPYYSASDFTTRDRYRHAVEELSRGSRHSETEVARQAVEEAAESIFRERVNVGRANRKQDPGHYLYGADRGIFEKKIQYRVPLRTRFKRTIRSSATTYYLGLVGLATALALCIPLVAQWTGWNAVAHTLTWLVLGVLALIPASELAVALVNHAIVGLFKPERLPKLKLADGIPDDLKTMVAVPMLLTSASEVEELVESLEVHYLSNPDGHIHFALLADWQDALSESMPGDEALVAIASAGISRLNDRYGPAPDGKPRFFFLPRKRQWNPTQRKWMGWERKRGKLHELNRALRGAKDTSFLDAADVSTALPKGVRYVITLDADTRLPREAGVRLVGCMAHPMNHPIFDPEARRVTEGYAILQPRVTPSLPAEGKSSLYQRLVSGPGGIDPYAAAVSDVYQDLFGEGSFTGKGIYDVDELERALSGRIPENTLLSHDLFEGVFARAGLASDIEVFEEFPSHYEVSAARQHRWVRGDWQLLPWILGIHRESIPLLGRWKMLDNLRRSLLAPASLLLLSAAWVLPGASPGLWTLFLFACLFLPRLLSSLGDILPRRKGVSRDSHLRGLGADLGVALSNAALFIVLVSHQAWLMGDAVLRTLVRLIVTRRDLLEWRTAAQSKISAGTTLGSFYRRMIGALILAALAGGALAGIRPQSWPWALPFLALWGLSPWVARTVSRPRSWGRQRILSQEDTQALRTVARRTWRYFEAFISSQDNWLPPDNFQEEPKPRVAHRTSPTNMGLYLLSLSSARDFGWMGRLDTAVRIEKTMATMVKLERFRGHFYNWYETRDLRPLEPKYVSTVDSGNLAGHLLTLGQVCLEFRNGPFFGAETLSGIEDAVLLAKESLARAPEPARAHFISRSGLQEALDAIAIPSVLSAPPVSLVQWHAVLGRIEDQAEAVLDMASTLASEAPAYGEVLHWSEAIRSCVRSHIRDLWTLAPWVALEGLADIMKLTDAFPSPALTALVSGAPSPAEIVSLCPRALEEVVQAKLEVAGVAGAKRSAGEIRPALGLDALAQALRLSLSACKDHVRNLSHLAELCEQMAGTMDFEFLYDRKKKLFPIGYSVSEGSPDDSYYDMLASESILGSFLAIAKGDAPVAHWFGLGRTLTPADRGAVLLSWSGSMFEYLMPLLVMRVPAGSLLDQTHRLVVARQINYGAQSGIPWGISESAYNARDLEMTYQYSNFGVPGLGLKRGLGEHRVVAPYATALAAMVDPGAAARNFETLVVLGAQGSYGFYESMDYTPARVPAGGDFSVVRAYFAHHQGMSLVALANTLLGQKMPARFHVRPMIQSVELLLQEKTPRDVAIEQPRAAEVDKASLVRDEVPPILHQFTTPHEPVPRTHLLSNGRYVVMLTTAGSGYSGWQDLAVTRWREDTTRDCWGSFIYLRDVENGTVWCCGYQPVCTEPDSYEVTFSEDKAILRRRDGDLETTMEVVVSPEDDAEVRRITVRNLGSTYREVELTSYAEIVLAPPRADLAHPAFSNLFVQTEWVGELAALLATRRPRSAKEKRYWAAHTVAVEGQDVGGIQYETDRGRFIGRGRTARMPMSVADGRPLSNTSGSVLDPIFSLRRRVRLAPAGKAIITFSTMAAVSREEVVALADKYRDPSAFERVSALAWTQAQVQMHHLGIGPDEARLFQRLANRFLYSDPVLRPASEVLKRNRRGPPGLWAHGISGDNPILLVRFDEGGEMAFIRRLLTAYEYWRMKKLKVDIVILNEKATSYAQELQSSLEALVRASQSMFRLPAHILQGKVLVLRADLLGAGDLDLLQSAARAVLSGRGSLSHQVVRMTRYRSHVLPPPRRPAGASPGNTQPSQRTDLEFFNGLGGFGANGREYVVLLGEGQWTPAPWINVISNKSFGFQVSESGSGYTWSENSRENKLTPWSNDPVSDPVGEVLYVRDDESGDIWGPTPLPIREDNSTYIIRHGAGYSHFEHLSHGILLSLLQFVAPEDPVKISRLSLENRSGKPRRLSVTAYAEWVLGASRDDNAPFITTEIDPDTGAMLAYNSWNSEFGGRVAFADLGGKQRHWTGDRKEFLGRNGSPEQPMILFRGGKLSDKVGAGLDPCCALWAPIEIPAGGRVEMVFLLGQGKDREEAADLVKRYRFADPEAALSAVKTGWDDILGTVQVKTPDRSMDLMLNRWLLYQTLACRIQARSAFYQSGGAYGFRDQLQDMMALTVARRDLAREHLLRSAARQFEEGDVQHWWHPPLGRGVRTRISDDRVWLPYAIIHYLEVTGDVGILEEEIPFITGPQLEAGQEDKYFEPALSDTKATLFEHAARALDCSLEMGIHGLPLIGAGDWNDGMNRVGHEGRGESVWLAWFLHSSLWEFAKLADSRGEKTRARTWNSHVVKLKEALERDAWDGDWYRRGYFDDGTPLGSATNTECRIDSIAQSWGVISGAADPIRAARAMASVEEYLVRRGDGLVLLFTPPFDHSPMDPGYIKGYLPGIRENGGQYTHAAIWSVLAFAALGDGDKAGELFSILNPVNQASTRSGIHRYKVEPYVAAADIYAEPPHVGRGGWTWYTGSAGWMYRAGLEWILGFRLRGTVLFIDPCIPRSWRRFQISFRYHSSLYEIDVENSGGVSRGVSLVELDGATVDSAQGIPLIDDKARHHVRVMLGQSDVSGAEPIDIEASNRQRFAGGKAMPEPAFPNTGEAEQRDAIKRILERLNGWLKGGGGKMQGGMFDG